MRTSRLRIVVLGYIIRGPVGGMAWHHLQYVLGLARLGHEVYFLEDSDDYESCYDPGTNAMGTDPAFGLGFTLRAFERLGLDANVAYYDAHTQSWVGPAAEKALRVCASADLLLNISGVNPLRSWHERIPLRVFIDTDPVFVQVRHLQNEKARRLAAGHNVFLSFGENIGAIAEIPDDGLPWRPTRQPVVLDCWPVTPGSRSAHYTTVMHWQSYPPARHNGRVYGVKSMSFGPYRDLPQRTGERFALAIGNPPKDLGESGWTVLNPLEVTKDPFGYQSFVMQSKAEFSVAKHGYVVSKSGWFSERSAGYLACGRPVLVEDTGFTQWLPSGRGVIGFNSPDQALAGLEEIDAHYESHCRAARDIALAYFDHRKVLAGLLDAVQSPAVPAASG